MPEMNHLHVHVRDEARSAAFYARWFGFEKSRRFGEVQFLRSPGGFDLALEQEAKPAAMPSWFHVGFRLDTADEVRSLHKRLIEASDTPVGDLHDEPDLTMFRVRDPDGMPIDVYWE